MSVHLQSDVIGTNLVRSVQDIFKTMLSMEIEDAADAPNGQGAPVVTASIRLGGAWNGIILLECRAPTACRCAAAMLGIKTPSADDEDVKDAMGELINMVAGNAKVVLGRGTYLSLPTVVYGPEYRFPGLGGRLAARAAFQTPVGVIYVSLVEIRLSHFR